MKARRLYTKMFVSFLAVLFVTELLIFILFIAVPAHRFGERLEHFAKERAFIVKNHVEAVIQSQPHLDWAQNDALKDFMMTFGRLVAAKLWITDEKNIPVMQSFSGAVPGMERMPAKHRFVSPEGFELVRNRRMEFYAVIPFSYSALQKGKIHIFFENRGDHPPLGYFAIGLVLVGALIALLVIPVSRPITRRINQLRQSTLRIADGDLSHRVAASGKDELAELGHSFNQMTTKLESMITNSRELTANISHEIRTPLTRIRISEEMLSDKLSRSEPASVLRYLNDIREDIATLDLLVGRILDLSKLDAQAQPLVSEPMDLGALIRSVAEKYQPAMDRRSLVLELDLPQQIFIQGNQEALCTAFSNLMDNAAKYTPPRGAVLLKARHCVGGIQATMTNTFGPLDEETLSLMFNPFQRLDNTGDGGSGLGLAIVKKIIEAHKGSITARNARDGLAFDIFISDTV